MSETPPKNGNGSPAKATALQTVPLAGVLALLGTDYLAFKGAAFTNDEAQKQTELRRQRTDELQEQIRVLREAVHAAEISTLERVHRVELQRAKADATEATDTGR